MVVEAGKVDPKGHKKNANVMAALAYFFSWLGGIVVLFFLEKEDEWVRFSAAQSIIVGIVLCVLAFVLSFVLIGLLIFPIWLLLDLYLAYMAYTWNNVRLPMVAQWSDGLAKPK